MKFFSEYNFQKFVYFYQLIETEYTEGYCNYNLIKVWKIEENRIGKTEKDVDETDRNYR